MWHLQVLYTSIYYRQDEDPTVLSLKKTLLGMLSSTIVISDVDIQRGTQWAYRINETGHEGNDLTIVIPNT